jgi:hypothetical protein
MNSRVAFPFLTLPDDAVGFCGWMIGDPGQPLQPAESLMQDWDYARDLEVSTTLSLDWDAASAALQLPKDELRLRVTLLAGTGTGNLPRRQDRVRELIVDCSSSEAQVSGLIAGRNLSGRLRIALLVTLDAPLEAGTVLSPKHHGARLWQCHHDILVEDGGDSRFPVETASFSSAFKGKPYEQAPWYLHWRPGALQADFSASIRLYVNSDREEVLARFVAGDQPTLQAIMGDVVSQMVESVLDHEDSSELLADCDEGSVGRQIAKWLELGFSGQETASIRMLRDSHPGAFRAAILAAAEMGGEE